jgi:hypothetical protein
MWTCLSTTPHTAGWEVIKIGWRSNGSWRMTEHVSPIHIHIHHSVEEGEGEGEWEEEL